MIAVIDYGAGNTGSVMKAARYLGYPVRRVGSADELAGADAVILPGQGHFGALMHALTERGLIEPLLQAIAQGKPYFGICLGLQALYEGSDEAPGIPGLGLLPGRVRKLEGVFKIPHVGWSQIEVKRPTPLLAGVADGTFFYYCHSYYAPVCEATTGTTLYGVPFSAVIGLRNVHAIQFHPEKSGEAGLRVFENFLKLQQAG